MSSVAARNGGCGWPNESPRPVGDNRIGVPAGGARPGAPPPKPSLPEERALLDAVEAATSTLSTLRRLDTAQAAPDPALHALVAEASEELEQALDELDAVRRRRTRHEP